MALCRFKEVFTLACISLLHVINAANFPSGCAYEDYSEAIGLYTCSFTNATFPLTYADFSSPIPQRLKVYDVNGTFTSPFSGFGAISISNTAYRAYLEISCATSGIIDLDSTSFSGMTHIQELRINNCIISDLPAGVFANLNLDFLEIEGGSITTTQSNSLQSLTISKLSNVPNPVGGISFKNVEFTGGNITAGFFDPLTSVLSITLDNCGIENLETSVFAQNTAVQSINLSRNRFTTLQHIFGGLTSLTFVNISFISWDCTCTNLWFTQWLASNYITLVGSYLCNTPTGYQNSKWSQYYYTECEIYDICKGIPGVRSGLVCYTWHQLIAYFALLIALTLTIIALIIFFNVRAKMVQTQRQIESKRKRVHTKIKEALIRGKDGQKAPASTSAPSYIKMPPRGWIDPPGGVM
ncbi:hypothetical protein FSP39_019221 [Pinctada imbricata]|uniref:Uncharacterized protein n=1 Tax=Pinctada imbricata TaxID=66713 RepID=A0AA89C8B2_PINIB|nr:hypothetical protein FSP39_019221 [Pinctada imbricata]